jgi:translation initiation factor IF-1
MLFRNMGLALVFVVFAIGCGRGTGEVSGVVNFKKQPLPGGKIQFMASDGKAYSADISGAGAYAVTLPTGDVKVIVSYVDEKKAKAAFQEFQANKEKVSGRAKPLLPPSGSFSLIPERYADWNKSGLSATITSGPNTHNFDLTE